MKQLVTLIATLLITLAAGQAMAAAVNISTHADILTAPGQTIGTGTGVLENGILTYQLEYVIDVPALGGPSILNVNGFIYDGVPPTGEGIATSCTGQALVCDPIELNVWGPETYASGGPLSETEVTILMTPPSASGNSSATTWTITPVATVPVPAAAWLFGSALIGLAGIKRKKNN